MGKEHKQVETILKALKRQFCIEFFVLVFFLFFIAVESGLSIVTVLKSTLDIEDKTFDTMVYFLVPSAVILVLFYFGTMIYFVRMANHYVNILIEKYNFVKRRVMGCICVLALWLLLTLIGFQLYDLIFILIFEVVGGGDDGYRGEQYYEVPKRIFVFMSMLTPLLLAIFVNKVMMFFIVGADKGKDGNLG